MRDWHRLNKFLRCWTPSSLSSESVGNDGPYCDGEEDVGEGEREVVVCSIFERWWRRKVDWRNCSECRTGLFCSFIAQFNGLFIPFVSYYVVDLEKFHISSLLL